MKCNRSELAEVLGVSLPSIDRFVRDGMPVERPGRRGVPARFDSAASVAWLRQRDAERAARRAPLPRLYEGQSRASREEIRELLRGLWMRVEWMIPWDHAEVMTLTDYEASVGLPRDGEILDWMRLGLPLLPPAPGEKIARVSKPHAELWRAFMGTLIERCGGDGRALRIGEEMRRLCGFALLDREEDAAAGAGGSH